MDLIIQTISIYALPVIFAITLHEAAHAYAAKYFGDLTAYSQGRVSLNPMVHIDPVGTILIPVVLAVIYISTGTGFLFGYAKPVPVNYSNLKKPKRDMAWVALAGPLANLIMAFGWLVLAALIQGLQVQDELFLSMSEFFMKMANAGLIVNLMMFAFNLFPVPPLDGGRILFSLLPHNLAYKFAQIEPYGFFIVMGLAMMNILKFWMVPVMLAANFVLSLCMYPFAVLFGAG
ncbi:peptidase M50 [Undibacterium sp. KW1]|uniref:site-2 protease family protein n=1 Tax=Undibacterium sp. KW1 TaxID=2058624 RepID=UPI001331DF13|nr:site-2 protease family protein [Undibacterium sp. KW1]BBB61120.1 peptidase M50 [Undibacterium sp. KW1]